MPVKTATKKPRASARPGARRRTSTETAAADGAPLPVAKQVEEVLSSLERMSTRRDRDNLERFGITASKAYGVSVANIQTLGKRL
jgi:hypothetical protein